MNRFMLKRSDGGFTNGEKLCLIYATMLLQSDPGLARALIRMTSLSNYDSML